MTKGEKETVNLLFDREMTLYNKDLCASTWVYTFCWYISDNHVHEQER